MAGHWRRRFTVHDVPQDRARLYSYRTLMLYIGRGDAAYRAHLAPIAEDWWAELTPEMKAECRAHG